MATNSAPLAFRGYTQDGRSLLITSTILTLLALVLVVLRGITARKKEGKWRADFIWIAIAVVFCVAAFFVLERSLYYGLGPHIQDLTLEQIEYAMGYAILYLELVLVSSSMAKFSIIALLIPVQGIHGRTRVYILWAIGIVQGFFAAMLMIFIITECEPVRHLWDVLSPGACPRKDFAHKWGMVQGGE